MKWRAALLLALVSIVFSTPAFAAKAGARVFIDIYSPNARKIRIAIPIFRPLGGGRPSSVGMNIARVIEEDLTRSGLFFVPPREGYLENPLRAGIRKNEQRFSDWSKVIKVEALVKGGYELSKNTIQVEAYL